ncbi:polysaccharide deacetylase family protein [Thermomonospora echinospora]|uniref:polysaccharide deacetylase family protein n=1 Tax=Thermomonospora echinospora TaxID=1992 RepID=UPI002E0F9B8D
MRNRRSAVLVAVAVGACLLSACGQDAQVRTASRRTKAPDGAVARPRQTPSTPPVDCTRAKCVALTFDDGPGPYTGRLLDDLAKARARATFFVLGAHVGPNAELVRRMVAEGHDVGNHTWSHPYLPRLSEAEARSEVQRTQEVVQQVAGVRPTIFRPPYGATNAQVGNAAGLPQIMWSVDPMDWRRPDAARTTQVVLRDTRPGSIVLLHDVKEASVAAVPGILAQLSGRGYRFVTVSELFNGTPLQPGRLYTGREAPPVRERAEDAGGTTLPATRTSRGTSTTSPVRRRTVSTSPVHDSRTPTTSLYPPVGSRRRSETRSPTSACEMETTSRAAKRADMWRPPSRMDISLPQY